MAKYRVYITGTISYHVDVEANSPEEACENLNVDEFVIDEEYFDVDDDPEEI